MSFWQNILQDSVSGVISSLIVLVVLFVIKKSNLSRATGQDNTFKKNLFVS